VRPSKIRSEQAKFIAPDLRQDGLKTSGKIDFFPMFAGLSTVSTVDSAGKPERKSSAGAASGNVAPKPHAEKTKATTPSYSLSGFNFDKIQLENSVLAQSC
jgi:hypothetical protein